MGPSPTSESLIRWTRRAADGLHCDWLAVHVDGPGVLDAGAQEQLARNLETARELGAQVLTTTDTSLVEGLLRVARRENVTGIVVGKPARAGWIATWKAGALLRQLVRESGDIELHVVRPHPRLAAPPPRPSRRPWDADLGRQYLFAFGAVAAAALLNLGLMFLAGPRVPGLVFLLTVVLLALKVGRGPVLAAGAASALLWNLAFLEPRFTFRIERAEDVVLFGTYFVVAVVLGQLVARIREQAQAERRREERATALYELTRDLAEATSRDQVVWQLTAQVMRIFDSPATLVLPADQGLTPHPDGSLTLNEKELAVADWAFKNRQPAGRFTHTLPAATAIHFPLQTERRTFGVLAVAPPTPTLAVGQRELLELFARQAALVLDRLELRQAAEQARLLAESERLGRTLLNSISHELRTPLAVSTSAVSALQNPQAKDAAHREMLLGEIAQANARLNRIVGNLLDVTRLESGQIRPHLDWHDVHDLVRAALHDTHDALQHHPLTVTLPESPLIAQFDFSLLQQALDNLLFNAALHTPASTPVEIRAEQSADHLLLRIADRGPGIPVALLPRLFQKFSRGAHAPAGGSGLGLAIVKGFVEAHLGTVTASNQAGGGARFDLKIPQPHAPTAGHEP
ncbi:MAG: DUF4118 domain-containing protein [Verrucomicrobiales bacterium]|nr:DUF4118 domain-containing protein [Verrucomicrobiales bacterium]